MTTTTATLRRPTAGLLLLAVLILASGAGLGQTFGEPGGFGAPSEGSGFVAAQPAESAWSDGEGYFIHDQLTKLLALAGFSLVALGIIAFRTFRLRKLLLAASVIVLGFVLGGVLCPISAVQNVILKAGNAYLLLFLLPVVLAILFGRLFCGDICPFGALQELLHVRKWHLCISDRWMRILGWVKYAVLAFLVGQVLATGDLLWTGSTPFKAFFLWGGTPVTLAVSGLFAVLSVVVYRPFCRVFCPLDALLSLVSRVSLSRVRVGSKCVSCGRCEAVCSSEATKMGKANAGDCLLCGECIRTCPPEELAIAFRRRR